MGISNSFSSITSTGSVASLTSAFQVVAGPMPIQDVTIWSALIKNTGAGNALTGVQVQVSLDTTSTSTSVIDWFNVNGDLPDGSLAVVIPGTLAATTTAMFSGLGSAYIGRWVRVRAKAATGSETGVRGYLHGLRNI